MKPIHIKFMLACYCSPTPHSELENQWASAAGQETLEWLREMELIDPDNRPTERGTAWVKFICATPLPEQVWVLPERSVCTSTS